MLKLKLRDYVRASTDSDVQEQIDLLYPQQETTPGSFHDSKYFQTLEKEVRELRNAVRTCEAQVVDQRQDYMKKSNGSNDQDLAVSLKIASLEQSLTRVPSHVASFSALSRILAISRLESTNNSTIRAIESLKETQSDLDKSISKEQKINDELKSLYSLLHIRLQEVTNFEASSSATAPNDIMSQAEIRRNEEDARNKIRIMQLRNVLENVAAPIIIQTAESIPGHPALDPDDTVDRLNELVLSLLNEMFDSTNLADYVKVPGAYNHLVKFLLNGNLITVKPNDPTFIRLREFGS